MDGHFPLQHEGRDSREIEFHHREHEAHEVFVVAGVSAFCNFYFLISNFHFSVARSAGEPDG
jgi:hypothetical protein